MEADWMRAHQDIPAAPNEVPPHVGPIPAPVAGPPASPPGIGPWPIPDVLPPVPPEDGQGAMPAEPDAMPGDPPPDELDELANEGEEILALAIQLMEAASTLPTS